MGSSVEVEVGRMWTEAEGAMLPVPGELRRSLIDRSGAVWLGMISGVPRNSRGRA